MKVYTLAGLTKRGKQIVKQHGDRWECLKSLDKVLFSDRSGPWILIVPLGEKRTDTNYQEVKQESASRWVHALADDNFKVMP